MLATALPKLLNLKEVIFSGSNDVWMTLADVLSTTHPHLESLTLEPEHDSEPVLPHLSHLSQFKLVRDHSSHSLGPFLVQNRGSLRRLCLCAYYAALPPSPALALAHLTHLEFVGTVPAGPGQDNIFAAILARGTQLVSLRVSVVLLTAVSPAFRNAPANCLPALKSFGFRALESMGAGCPDPQLFPSITDFLRLHHSSQLEKLELDVAGTETGQKALGYDASVLGVLPTMTQLKHLAITITKDASPGLFSWIIPRGLSALLLSGPGVPRRGCEQFMTTMRPGLPTNLKYIALLGTEVVRSEVAFVETCLPASVRLVNIDDRFYTVKRRRSGSGREGGNGKEDRDREGHVEGLEEWPERRVRLHAEEWLEALGCEDAMWDDFAPAMYG